MAERHLIHHLLKALAKGVSVCQMRWNSRCTNRNCFFAFMAERYFTLPLQTDTQAFITGPSCRCTGIASAHTTTCGVTDFLTIAEESVIRTIIIIGCVYAGIVQLVAGIDGTVNPIITTHVHSRLTGACSVADLFTVAELAVGTRASHWFKSAVRRTAIAIQGIAVIALLKAFNDTVAAGFSFIAGTGRFVTDSAGKARIAGGGTVELSVTEFSAVAEQTIIRAIVIIRRIVAGIACFIAHIRRTANAVIAVHRGTRLTVKLRITGLIAIAECTIVTKCIVRRAHTGVVDFITGIDGAIDSIVTIHGYSRLTGARSIAGLLTIAEQTIRTGTSRWFKSAVRRTAVAVKCIAVVAFFKPFHNTVTAGC